MASKKRVYQVAERIKEIVAQQLLKSADPRFTLVTITSAVISPDLRVARIYWVIPPSEDEAARKERIEEVSAAFKNSEGWFRKAVGGELDLRCVPSLKFFYDDTFDTVDQVERLMFKISKGGSA